MKNILIVGLCAVVLFGLSAGISLYLASLNKPKDTVADKDKQKEKEKDKDTKSAKPKDDGEPAVPVVGEPTPKAAEEVAQLLARLRQRSADLTQREDQARKQEKRMETVMDDVRAERVVIDTLRKQLTAELAKLNERQDGVNKDRRNLEAQKSAAEKVLADLKGRQIGFEKNESKNLVQLAAMMNTMEPDKAASLITKMSDDGEMDTAVKLVAQMDRKKAAGVLTAIKDVALAAQIMKRVRGLTPPDAKKDEG